MNTPNPVSSFLSSFQSSWSSTNDLAAAHLAAMANHVLEREVLAVTTDDNDNDNDNNNKSEIAIFKRFQERKQEINIHMQDLETLLDSLSQFIEKIKHNPSQEHNKISLLSRIQLMYARSLCLKTSIIDEIDVFNCHHYDEKGIYTPIILNHDHSINNDDDDDDDDNDDDNDNDIDCELTLCPRSWSSVRSTLSLSCSTFIMQPEIDMDED